MFAFGLSACDNSLETDPRPAEIEFLFPSTATICQETDLRVRVRDVNGLENVKLFVDGDVVATLPADGTERTLSRNFAFTSPGSHGVKILAFDAAGDSSEDSTLVDVQPDDAYDFWPMGIGKSYSFQYTMDGRTLNGGGTPPRQLEGRLDWTVVGSEPGSEDQMYQLAYHFVGSRRDYDWDASQWGEWTEVDYVGNGELTETENGIRGDAGTFVIQRPIPRYYCFDSNTISGEIPDGVIVAQWTLTRRGGISTFFQRTRSSGADRDDQLEAEN